MDSTNTEHSIWICRSLIYFYTQDILYFSHIFPILFYTFKLINSHILRWVKIMLSLGTAWRILLLRIMKPIFERSSLIDQRRSSLNMALFSLWRNHPKEIHWISIGKLVNGKTFILWIMNQWKNVQFSSKRLINSGISIRLHYISGVNWSWNSYLNGRVLHFSFHWSIKTHNYLHQKCLVFYQLIS